MQPRINQGYFSHHEEAYFLLVDAAQKMVNEGRRFSFENSVSAASGGFPQPLPSPGQVWWVNSVDGICPVLFGSIESSRPGIYCRRGSNLFLQYDPNVIAGYFVYSPTPDEYDVWKNPVQSFDPVI